MYKFAAASEREPIVFGAARPGYANHQVQEWIQFMQAQSIQHICCLLTETHLNRYADLLGTYRKVFGPHQICWAPVKDFSFVDANLLMHQILPFLAAANQKNEKVVVHCSGGMGRTGHVLAAWLIAGRGFSKTSAIAAVSQMGRNPREAVIAAPFRGKNPWKAALELNRLLDACIGFQ
jgi:protein-tyrosine phosphatase